MSRAPFEAHNHLRRHWTAFSEFSRQPSAQASLGSELEVESLILTAVDATVTLLEHSPRNGLSLLEANFIKLSRSLYGSLLNIGILLIQHDPYVCNHFRQNGWISFACDFHETDEKSGKQALYSS